jgi:hypothetical protein
MAGTARRTRSNESQGGGYAGHHMKSYGLALVLCATAVLVAGCQQMDELTRPQEAYSTYPGGYEVRVADGLSLAVKCARLGDQKPAGNQATDSVCAYRTVDETSLRIRRADSTTAGGISDYFMTCSESDCIGARNRIIDVLLKVSDENCSSFLQSLFLTKSTSDSTYSMGRDLLTGGAAAAAVTSPPAAVGMSFANLLLRSYEAVNSTFFLDSAYQSLDSAIRLDRAEKLRELMSSCRRPSPGSSASYDSCTISEAMRLVRGYDDACSLRAGVNKLQSLVHLQENREEVEALQAQKKSLSASAKELHERNEQLSKLDVTSKIRDLELKIDALSTALEKRPIQPEPAGERLER